MKKLNVFIKQAIQKAKSKRVRLINLAPKSGFCFTNLLALAVLGAGLMFSLPSEVKAETINYTGDVNDLKTAPTWFGGGVSDVLFPGTTENPSASGNTVNVNFTTGPGKTNPNLVFGGLSEKNSVYNNTVNISGGTINMDVYGGYVYSGSGNAYNNTVNISAGTINGLVYGGRSDSGDAYANTVNISAGTIGDGMGGGNVYGGYVFQGTGNAYANTVNISGGTIGNMGMGGGDVYGGYVHSGAGDAYANTVNISGTALIWGNVYGGRSFSGKAYANTVNISAGTIGDGMGGGNVYGGYVFQGTGNAYANTVNISGGTIGGDVYGGYVNSGSGDAYGNTVNISGGTIGGDVDGGDAWGGGNAYANTVNISGGTEILGYVYGGYVESGFGNAYANTVNISGGTIDWEVYGGFVNSGSGDAYANTVNISGGTIGDGSPGTGNVYGGYVWQGSGNAYNNTVNISGNAEIWRDVYGGYVMDGTGNAYANTVNISGGTIGSGPGTGNVYGGRSFSGKAYNNTVNISGDADIGGSVYGGYVWQGSGDAYANTVNISGGTIDKNVFGGYVHSGAGDAYANTVNISAGTIGSGGLGGNVFGGNVESGSGDAYANTVNISGTADIKRDVYGGWSRSGDAYANTVNISGDALIKRDVLGGFSGDGSAYANTVNISGGTIGSGGGTGNVYGGYVYDGTGNAYANTVNISGGTINGFVYGGYSQNGKAINNQVILSGTPTFNAGSTWLFGGESAGGGDKFTGNTLWVLNRIGNPVSVIKNFENYRFLLPNTWTNDPMLTATNFIDLTDGGSRIATVDRLGIASGGTMPNIGDKYTLLEALNIFGGYTAHPITAYKGISLLYDMNVKQEGLTKITATVASGAKVNPQTKALSEGIVSGVAFINQGADLAAGQGMGSALSSANAAGAGNLSSFGAMSAGSSRYNTGSHSDVDSFSLMTGLGWNAPIAQNSLLLGAFFEVGFGNYDSHNSFSGRASIDGSGDTEYYGGGILARYSLTEGFLEGLYTEASLRVGHVSTDFSSNDFEAFSGPINVSYDSSSVYYGAHAGLGYIWQLSEKADLDFSTKYFWTHQNGDDVTVAGDPIKFEDADSHRWRNGVRFSYEIDKNATPYVGAAYDYEFDGKANATAYGRSIEAPELKGGTGVGELGIILKPMVNHDFSVDLGLQGYTGMREGVSGSLQMKYEF